jgi:iron(III) transport system permease protein
METLADYGTVYYFGVPTLTTGVFRAWFSLGESTTALQMSAILLGATTLLLVLERSARARLRFFQSGGHPSPREALRGWTAALALFICLVPVLFGFALPFGLLLNAAITRAEWGSDFAELARHSLLLAAIASLLIFSCALVLIYAQRLAPGRMIRMAVRTAGLGYALPGTIIALGVIVPCAWLDTSLNAWAKTHWDRSFGLLLSGSLFAVLFGYTVRFACVALSTLEAGLARIKPHMDEAARGLGCTPAQTLWRIHLPLLKGSSLTALLLVFVDTLKELPATLILRPFDFNTLAVRTYELANVEHLADAAAPAVSIVAVAIAPVLLLNRAAAKSSQGTM